MQTNSQQGAIAPAMPEMKGQAESNKKLETVLRTASLSNETRDYIVLLGKLHDLWNEFYDLLERDYGTSQAESITNDVFNKAILVDAYTEVEKYIIWSINGHIGSYSDEI